MRVKGNRKVWITVSLAALLVLAMLAGTGAFTKAKPIAPEKILKPELGNIARSVVARGRIEPLSKVEVKSKANGIIQKLLVDVGDTVKEGQILAELDKEDLQAQVRGAKAALEAEDANQQSAIAAEARSRIEAANPELEFARRDYERAQGLFKEKIASQQQLDDASRAYEMAQNRQKLLDASVQTAVAQVAQSKAALDRAEESLHYATIRSPINGVVLVRPTEIGDAVSSILNLGSSATLIMTLGDISSVYIKGHVDEADIGKASCGQPVRTRVESFPNESFAGVVKRIAPMGKELNNVTTFEVRVTIGNLEGKLRANMTANAEIVLEERTNVLTIAESALVYDKDKNPSVQLLDASNKQGWRKQPLKLGISNGQRAQILEGLTENDRIVIP